MGDPAGLPHRHLTGQDSLPDPGEPVGELDRVPQVPAPGVGGVPDRQRELRDRALVDRGGAVAGDLQLPHPPLDRGVDLLARVQLHPCHGLEEQLDLEPGHRVPGRPGSRDHLLLAGRDRGGRGAGHRSTQALATDTDGAQNPVVHRVLSIPRVKNWLQPSAGEKCGRSSAPGADRQPQSREAAPARAAPYPRSRPVGHNPKLSAACRQSTAGWFRGSGAERLRTSTTARPAGRAQCSAPSTLRRGRAGAAAAPGCGGWSRPASRWAATGG